MTDQPENPWIKTEEDPEAQLKQAFKDFFYSTIGKGDVAAYEYFRAGALLVLREAERFEEECMHIHHLQKLCGKP